MAAPRPSQPPQAPNPPSSKKRKEPPPTKPTNKSDNNKRPKTDHHRARQRDARHLATQTTSQTLQHGNLDVDKFVQAREFEIRALERGIQKSGKANNRRAFQQVPRELRRRTASHNVKRVPKRLRGRAGKEMIEDKTPTVTAKTRKPTRHMRLRMENVKRLRALGVQKTQRKNTKKAEEEEVTVTDADRDADTGADTDANLASTTDQTTKKKTTTSPLHPRRAKIQKHPTTLLAKPPLPKSKFRKRQIHKSWLPTHLFHAKRARMTPPSAPLWRFAIPLTPTQKSYRPTHRAAHDRGAVARDSSYMAVIGLEGRGEGVEGVLRALGVDLHAVGRDGGEKWKNGRRVTRTWVYERESREAIAPVEVIWCVSGELHEKKMMDEGGVEEGRKKEKKRRLFIRVHPSAFFQLWEEVVRLCKIAKPAVSVEDLRFEIGSIEIVGPGSTEALLGALWPSTDRTESNDVAEKTWTHLAGLTNPSILPQGALLGFDVQDPRLHHPPRTIKLPKTQQEYENLLLLAADWPVDKEGDLSSPGLFDRTARLKGSKLRSQKAINRRKGLAPPGAYPDTLPTDPRIPILLYTSPSSSDRGRSSSSSWTVLAPWKCIQPLWYGLMYCPLSTGQQPRFGGLNEERQLVFEAQRAWFPADFPGTKAGWEWEVTERRKRWEEWRRRPKGKRTVWEKVDIGGDGGRKGEVGVGWGCDWGFLLGEDRQKDEDEAMGDKTDDAVDETKTEKGDPASSPPSKPEKLTHLTPAQALKLFKSPTNTSFDFEGKLITVCLTLLTSGVPQTCARIYRIPSENSNPELRKAWLDLLPSAQTNKKKRKTALPNLPKDTPSHILQQRLAQSLLEPPRAGEETYPSCPPEEDLIGFVTTGNFNLAEGRGTGIGSLLVGKVLEDLQMQDEGREKCPGGRLCVVRNSGNEVGRLARWDVV